MLKFVAQTLTIHGAKINPRKSNYIFSFAVKVSQFAAIHFSSTLAGVSCSNSLRLAKQNDCHGRLPLVDAIVSTRVVSNDSY